MHMMPLNTCYRFTRAAVFSGMQPDAYERAFTPMIIFKNEVKNPAAETARRQSQNTSSRCYSESFLP
jgi:hypothetical protein